MKIEKIYLDMDGVLADFDRGVRELCGLAPIDQGVTGPDEEVMWDGIRNVPHFYDRLELMSGAKDLFDALYGKYGEACEILTGIPKPARGITGAKEDKIRWVRRLLSGDIVIHAVYRREKYLFCTSPAHILIDDFGKNIKEWENSGGTGILSKSAAQTMIKLRELDIL